MMCEFRCANAVVERDTFFVGVNKVPAKVQRTACRDCGRKWATKEQVAFNQENMRKALKKALPAQFRERDVFDGGGR